MKKYKLTTETRTLPTGEVLYRIQALKDFSDVCKGDLGGWVASEDNLSQEGDAWVYDNACVYGAASVSSDACVYDIVHVYGNANLSGKADVGGTARVFGNACVCDDTYVCGSAFVYDNAYIRDYAIVCGDARVYGDTIVCDDALVDSSETPAESTLEQRILRKIKQLDEEFATRKQLKEN